jgi:S-adenosylmethionine decarboxylase
MAVHVIGELYGIDRSKLEKIETISRILDSAISESKLNCLGKLVHQFEPSGVSAIYLLAESHLSIHTWPEKGYVALDVFTCSSDLVALTVFRKICQELKPRKILRKIIRRNYHEKSGNKYTEKSIEVSKVVLGFT